MFFLTALAMATTMPMPEFARASDCKPMLSLASSDQREAAEPAPPREANQRRGDTRPRPQKRCITLASA